jgi:hypothetical protein
MEYFNSAEISRVVIKVFNEIAVMFNGCYLVPKMEINDEKCCWL